MTRSSLDIATTTGPGELPPASGIVSTIGHTPMVRLDSLFAGRDLSVYAKLEFANPGGSMKDRVALNFIREAIDTGDLVPGLSTVVESSSGNLGVGLAQVCRYFDLGFICVVDPRTNTGAIATMKAFGAEVDVVTERDEQTGEYLPVRIARVQSLVAELAHGYWPNQYDNLTNPRTHELTMREIDEQLGRSIDYLFCATSTCGTLRGCRTYLRRHGHDTTVVAVDASGSAIFRPNGGRRRLPGHGAAFQPPLFQDGLADRVELISDLDSVRGCRLLVEREAILAGASSGAVVAAIERMLDEIEPGANCVAILADRGDRYLETVYDDAWVHRELGGELRR